MDGSRPQQPRNTHSHGVEVSGLQSYHITVQCPDLNKSNTAHKQEARLIYKEKKKHFTETLRKTRICNSQRY